MRELREIRLRRGLSQADLSAKTGVAEFTISEIESGKRANPRPSTLRKLAQALDVEVADLYGSPEPPLAEASPSPEQPSFNELLEEERRATWENALEDARQLRETGRDRLEDLLGLWRRSKWRQEGAADRREYLDKIGSLLQEAYDAETALIRASGGQLGVDQLPELLEADRFYVELCRLVQDVGLSIHTEAAQQGQPESHTVEETRAA